MYLLPLIDMREISDIFQITFTTQVVLKRGVWREGWMEIQSILCTSTKLRKINLCQFSYVLLTRFLFIRSHLESYGNISSVILTQCKLKLKTVLLPMFFPDVYIAGLVAKVFKWIKVRGMHFYVLTLHDHDYISHGWTGWLKLIANHASIHLTLFSTLLLVFTEIVTNYTRHQRYSLWHRVRTMWG